MSKKQDRENITKAFQCSEMLCDEIREGYCKTENKLLQRMLFKLIDDAVKINQELKIIQGGIRE